MKTAAVGAGPRTARKPAPVLERTTFRTSRLAEFCSTRELVAQTGHPIAEWPLVTLKELTDNAIDICEEKDIAPEIAVSVSTEEGTITVADNGPGIPPQTIIDVLDYSVRVSSREAYVSPTRGAQGNALQTLLAMGFALDSQEPVETIIEAGGTAHRIVFGVDQVRQEPRIDHQTAPSNVKTGTSVRLRWPNSACLYIEAAEQRFLQIVDDFAWLNPHLTITAAWNGKRRVARKATKLDWRKWRPNEATSAHWYDLARFERYMGRTLPANRTSAARARRASSSASFAGSAAAPSMLDEVGAARSALASYFGEGLADHAANARLLAACQKHTRPVKPGDLGVIGKQHLEAIFVAAGAAPKSFEHRRTPGVQNGLPWVAESAFGIVETGLPIRRLISGVNWSVATGSTPFRSFGRHVESLDSLLTDLRAGRDEPVIALIHLANPRIDYTDRGKSAVNLGDADDDKSRFADRLVETIVGAVLRGE